MSPPSLLSLPSFKDVGNEKGGEKEVWVSVFRYLTRAQLLTCMSVCKAWYKWCVSAPLRKHATLCVCVFFLFYLVCFHTGFDSLPPLPPAGAATSVCGATLM